jgi:hypothetical protein
MGRNSLSREFRELRGFGPQLLALTATFFVVTLIAWAFGAGWGTASGFGQIAFAAVLVALLLRAL